MKIFHDTCVIGSSPISLLTAIKLSKINQKIMIAEKILIIMGLGQMKE